MVLVLSSIYTYYKINNSGVLIVKSLYMSQLYHKYSLNTLSLLYIIIDTQSWDLLTLNPTSVCIKEMHY